MLLSVSLLHVRCECRLLRRHAEMRGDSVSRLSRYGYLRVVFPFDAHRGDGPPRRGQCWRVMLLAGNRKNSTSGRRMSLRRRVRAGGIVTSLAPLSSRHSTSTPLTVSWNDVVSTSISLHDELRSAGAG